jgi:hypothetical protein
MATVLTAQADPNYPVYKPEGGLAFGYGVYEIATALSKDDLVSLFYLPTCRVTSGFLRADDLDTGTEAMEIDIGHTGHGSVSADPDAFLNSGVITGDAIAGIKPEVQIYIPFNGVLKDGPHVVTAEALVQAKIVAAANAGGTGTMYVGAYYLEPLGA